MSLLFFTLFLLSTCIVSSVCELMCYECNSLYDGVSCEVGSNLNGLSLFARPCAGRNANYVEEYEKPLCRKVEQKIKSRNNMRVIKRSCGWERSSRIDDDLCYRYRTEDHEEVACQCFGHLCNSAHIKSSNVYWSAAYSLLVLLGIINKIL